MAGKAFSVVVLVALAAAALFGLLVVLMQVQPAFMGGMAHFSQEHHRIHDLTFSFLLGTGVVGLLAQLRDPSRNGAAQLMAMVPFVGLTLALVLTNLSVLQIPWAVVGSFTLLATTLHPTAGAVIRSLGRSRVERVMLGLVVVAAVPLIAFALTNIELQRTAGDDHAAAGHYGFMTAFSFTIIGVGLLASMRPDGWRLTAWVAGILAVLLGLASFVFADVVSRLDPMWALAVLVWGAVFVAAAEITARMSLAEEPAIADRATPPGAATLRPPRTPLPAIIAGAIVIVLVLLFVAMHLTGGGPGLHAPPGAS